MIEQRSVEAKTRWVTGYEWQVKEQQYGYINEEWREYFSEARNAWVRDRREGSERKKP
jgi:hypothetical protein